ncbi:hypothetical protein [Promicromonospora sp. NPDC023987]|uniref:hypothetical protein n=1 Tax=Promicromonospora sp. NPDC023987 TaxID=3155360 RepID=UPI0033EF72C0
MIRAWIAGHRMLAGSLLALALIGIAVTLHLSTDAGPTRSVPSTAPSSSGGQRPTADPQPDEISSDREAADFARHVADLMFTWDTATDDRDQIVEQVLAFADPTGVETPGLVIDLEAYLPDELWWDQLRQYRAAQWFDVDDAAVPRAWTAAEARGDTDDLAPGTTAVTLSGTLHRAGYVAGELETVTSPLELTMFVACTGRTCAVLRLGSPGKVLDHERLL